MIARNRVNRRSPRQEPSNDDPNANSLSQDVDAVLDPNLPQDSQPELDADAEDKAPEGETRNSEIQNIQMKQKKQKKTVPHVWKRERQEAEEAAARDANAAADAKLTQEERDAKLPFHTHPQFVASLHHKIKLYAKNSL